MNSDSTIKSILKDPVIGIVPFIVFSIIVVRMDVYMAILLVMSLSFAGRYIVRPGHRLFYNLSFATSLIVLITLLLLPFKLSPIKIFSLFEMVFVALIISCRLLNKRATFGSLCSKKNKLSPSFSICASNSFVLAFKLQYYLLLHLFILLAYVAFFDKSVDTESDLLGRFIVLLFLLSIFVGTVIRSLYISHRLKNEEWLPIVGECGKVKGRVTKSESNVSGAKYMHPLLRVAVIHNGMIYLKNVDVCDNKLSSRLDHPLETLISYNMGIEDTLCSTMYGIPNGDRLSAKFLLKYMYENEKIKRLVYLFVSVVKDDADFDTTKFEGGKLWTISQIQDNLNSDVFSEMFELEFDYLKNTIILAEKIVNRDIA